MIEVVWTLVPVLILVLLAIPSIGLLSAQFKPPPKDAITLKATGNQWYWTYTYPDNGGFEITANMLKEKDEVAAGERARTEDDGPPPARGRQSRRAAGRRADPADHDLGRRDPQLGDAGVLDQARRGSRPPQRDQLHDREAGPLFRAMLGTVRAASTAICRSRSRPCRSTSTTAGSSPRAAPSPGAKPAPRRSPTPPRSPAPPARPSTRPSPRPTTNQAATANPAGAGNPGN